MSTTITIRADESLREELQRRARNQGKSVSAVVREILSDALESRALGDRAGHLRGRLELPVRDDEPWREELRQRNWRR
jgi:plasmid stability protein